ncbi:MAG: FMN-binding protein [Spartobacteria bacterium]|nr:FMN-binding protein [Spartobacteria bacterium]
MKNSWYICIILIVTGLAGSMGYAKGRHDDLTPVSDAQWRDIAASKLGVTELELHSDPFRWGYAPHVGWVVLTGDVSAPVGYRGPTSLMLHIDPSGTKLVRVILVESGDTPPYVDMVISEGFLDRFAGKDIASGQPLAVDAVSGATRTCTAIHRAVNDTLRRFLER